MRRTFSVLGLSLVVLVFGGRFPALRGDDAKPAEAAKAADAAPARPAEAAPAKPGDAKPAEAAPADDKEPLSASQELLSRRYKRFVDTLRKVAENIKKTDPTRAELLNRAIGKSNKEGISRRMDEIAELLGKKSFGGAAEEQQEVMLNLNELLQLLLSENESIKNKAEQERIKNYINILNGVIRKEKDLRAATERKENPDDLAKRQKKVADDTRDLGKKIADDDAAKKASDSGEGKPQEGDPKEGKPGEGKPNEGKPSEGKPSEGKPSEGKPMEGDPKEGKPMEGKPMEGKPSEGKPSEGKPSEGKPSEGKPSEGKPSEGKPSEGKPSEGKPSEGKPSEGKPSEGKPSEGKPSEGKPSDGQQDDKKADDKDKTPGRDELEKARDEMERAIEELKKKAHDAASDAQDNALRELQKAKEKLEEILRQLRDEEKTRFLQALEARFQKMLTMQVQVYDGTVRIDRTATDQRTGSFLSRSKELSRTEEEIVVEATRALTLLKEEGSAVAFPEAVEQMRDDMQMVARWLGKEPDPDTGKLTQAVEKEIIDALEEMIEALQKEIEKMKEKKDKDPQDQEQGENEDQLVDLLGELKLLRSLQQRINRRTKTLGREVKGEQAQEASVVEQLRSLADRQARIQKAAADLATGRNK